MSSATQTVSDPIRMFLDQVQAKIDHCRSSLEDLRAMERQLAPNLFSTLGPAPSTPHPDTPPARRRVNGQGATKTKTKAPKATGSRRSTNEKPLILIAYELVKNSDGLVAGDVTKKIHDGRLFKSKSSNIGNMVTTQLYKLRDHYKVIQRDEESKKWTAIPGAVYPPASSSEAAE